MAGLNSPFLKSVFLRGLLAFLVLILSCPRDFAAEPTDLQNAFKAAFGQSPPAFRQHRFGDGLQVDYRLDPLLLVHLSGMRYALIVPERFSGPHFATGSAAIAYLNRDRGQWRPVRVWYDIIQSGSFGAPFVGDWLFRFGVTPFFAGDGEYCGMGACTDQYALIALYPNGPASWGSILDAGMLETGFYGLSDGDGELGCGGYRYSSFISAPKKKGDLMQVTYAGWILPGGNGQRRRWFHNSTEVAPVHDELHLQAESHLPNCGE